MGKNASGLSLLISAAIGFASLPGSVTAAPSICDAIPGNLIVNCGFEKGLFRGWTQSGNTSFLFVVGPGFRDRFVDNPNSGNQFAALGPFGSDGFLSQTFRDTAGQQLRVEFFLANDGATPNDFHAAFNDNMLLSLTNDGAHGFTDNAFIVTATGLDTLTIGGFRHDLGFFGLDDISVAPVPEPGSLGLLGIILASLGIRIRRRSEPPRGALDQDADRRSGHR
jgi:hypothetical protein